MPADSRQPVARNDMNSNLKSLWSQVAQVSDGAHCRTWVDPDSGQIRMPDDWPWPLAQTRLEYRAFGVFLLSHAMLHHSQERNAWATTMNFCSQQTAQEFADIAVEGGNLDQFLGARVQTFGEWSQSVRSTKRSDEEPMGWIRILKNNLLSCSNDQPSRLNPPIMIGNAIAKFMFEVKLAFVLESIYIPGLYAPVCSLCDHHRSLLTAPAGDLKRAFDDVARTGQSDADAVVKKSSVWRKLFRLR